LNEYISAVASKRNLTTDVHGCTRIVTKGNKGNEGDGRSEDKPESNEQSAAER